MPGTLADESDSPPALVANALTLAAQQQHTLRLVILAVPNIDHDTTRQQQQQTPLASRGVTPSPRGQPPSGDLRYMTSTAAAANAGTPAAADSADGGSPTEKQHMDPIYREEGKRNLESANKEGRILAGTVDQVVLLLERIAAGSSGADGVAAPRSQ